jgi:ribosomal protein S18 acetylase RimI-like enzyme
MFFRKATIDDIDSIMEIVADARQSLGSRGVDQWQDGNPTRAIIQNDIANKVGEVVMVDGVVAAYVCIMVNGEPEYANIDGKWFEESDYVVIHRICVRNSFVRRGIATAIMQHTIEFALSHGIRDVKIDTHKDNRYMLDFLEKFHFVYCGEIHYHHGDRVAYELKL